MIITDLKMAFFSYPFWISVIGVTIFMFFTAPQFLVNNTSIFDLLDILLQGSGLEILYFCVFPVFAFSLCFAKQWTERSAPYIIIRSGIKNYIYSKVFVSFLSGFMVLFIGINLFVILLLPFKPVFVENHTAFPYAVYLENGKNFLGIISLLIHFSLSGSLSAVCSLWFSTYFPNRFASAIAPLVINFTLIRIFNRIEIPEYLQPIYWWNAVYNTGNPESSFILKVLIIVCLCALLSVDSYKNIKRRITTW